MMWLERDAQQAIAQFGKDLQALRPAFKLSMPRRRVSKRWDRAVLDVGLPPAPVLKTWSVPAGSRLVVRVGRGIATDDLIGKTARLEAAMGVRLRIERDSDHPGQAIVALLDRDPLSGSAGEWPGHNGPISSPFPIAINEDGETVYLDMFHRHVLIGGQTGFGKTNLLNLLIAVGTCDPSCNVHLIDVAKRGAGLGSWERKAATFAATRSDSLELLANLKITMDARWDNLRAGRRFETDRMDRTDLLVIDELAPLLIGKEGRDVSTMLWELLSVGRAAGLNVVASMQKPHGGAIDTNARDLFSHRFAFRASTPEMGTTITGFPYPMHPMDYPVGVALMLTDDGMPRRVKVHQVVSHGLGGKRNA